MILKIVLGSLLALSAANAISGNMYIYKDKAGKTLLTSVNPSGNLDKFTKKVKTTYYENDSLVTTNNSYANSAYIALNSIDYTDSNDKNKRAIKVAKKPKTTTDNVTKFYKPLDWSQTDKQNFEYLKSTEAVKVTEDNDLDKAYSLMLTNGYSLLGRSEFNDRTLPNSVFISQAKKLGASHVIIYKESTSAVQYSINDDLNDLDYAYLYVSDFYVKNNSFNKPNILGVNHGEIPLEKRNQFQRNTGAYINNVIRDSRAYFANIILGDVVIAVNGKEIRVNEDFNRIKDSELKTTRNLNLTIIRLVNNEPKEIQIPVSFN